MRLRCKRTLKSLALFVVSLAASVQAFAHEGHAHDHWTSPFVHGLLAVSLVLAAGCAVYGAVRLVSRFMSKQNTEVES